ncbi:something about silencing protein 10 [Eucyclogobius newberryi]|uniref:something about silencing protein 10 n=1 Tax=Eucyclogobius newberryi TaxID=166745 RepID=UPI003B5973DD
MVRAQRSKPMRKPKTTPQYDEDDPAAYSAMPVPDKRSSSYTKDKIDDFHAEKIKSLLAQGVQMDSEEEQLDDEEELMALDESEEEEDVEEEDGTDMESDLEEKKEEDLPDEMAWGKKKKLFYDTDYVTAKGKKPEELEEEEKEEEEEAIKIQNRLAANLSEEDYDMNFLQEFAVEEKDEESPVVTEEKIVKDLKDMSQKEKMKLLKKESPELLELIQDFKTKLTELKDDIQPLVQMVTDGKIPPGKGAEYLKTKQQLYLNYCTNISFYLVLKAKRIPAHNHPVIERLLTYRNLINELSAVDARLAPQFQKLLAGGERRSSRKTEGKKTSEKETDPDDVASGLSEDSDSDLDEVAALQFYKGIEQRLKLKRKGRAPEAEKAGENEAEVDEEAKRRITYQMAKNKGLTPKRKKIDRNPRVKHREKFRRAKIRRKGQVREVRTEDKRYTGEASGIRAGVKKSVKLKV